MRRIILAAGLLLAVMSAVYAQDAQPGSDGIGDPYFPTLGNGGYDALHYTLDLRVDMETNTLAGTVTMALVSISRAFPPSIRPNWPATTRSASPT